MAEDVTTSVDGLDELARNMEALPGKLAARAARPALSAAGQVMKAAAVSTAPRLSGTLAGDVGVKVQVSNNLDTMQVIVGPKYTGGISAGYKNSSQDPGVYGLFQEKGTRRTPPTFWMSRAFNISKKAATDAAIQVLKAVVDQLSK